MKLPDHLLEYQTEAMHKLAMPGSRVLGLPPGAGKSVVAIASWELLGAFDILVVCPAIVRADWKDKVERFAHQTYNIGTAPKRGRNVVIRSYESLNTPPRRAALLQMLHSFDVLILDEAQRLRNPESAITHSIYGAHANGHGLTLRAKHTWPLSGTIAVNHIGDLYAHLRALAPELLPKVGSVPMKYQQFLDHFGVYEATRWGIRMFDMKNTQELKSIVGKFVIQCDREVVNRQLPKLRVETMLLPEDELDATAYLEFVNSKDGQLLQRVVTMGDIWELTDSLATARRILGELKAQAVARYVRELLEADPDAHVLIFAHHRTVMQLLWRDLHEAHPLTRVIDGSVPEPLRQSYIKAFQEGAGGRVLIAGIATMREGVTLTTANRIVFAEASWVPAENEQAIARAYRLGQQLPVLAEFVCIANTLDEAVMRVCARKADQLSSLL